MNKFILATAAVALSATTAFAGQYGETTEESDPYIPVETAASSSSAGGMGGVLAAVGGLLVVGALLNSSSSSSSD